MAANKFRIIVFAGLAFSSGILVGSYWRLRYQSSMMIPKNAEYKNMRNDQVGIIPRKNSPFKSESGTCTPQKNIMFLKTHKTASSAVQNVLLRYADKNSLVVGLSNLHDIRFHYGSKFKESYVAKSKEPINILCHHMVFDLPEVKKVMTPESMYVSILREPTSLFESMFDYFHYDSTPFSRVKMDQLEFWLDHTDTGTGSTLIIDVTLMDPNQVNKKSFPDRGLYQNNRGWLCSSTYSIFTHETTQIYPSIAFSFFKGRRDGVFPWFAKNGIFFDMGYDNLNEDDIYIQNAIVEMEETFHLVMLADYFSESMLLLKELLCWSMDDILVLKTNARTGTHTQLTDSIKSKIRKWNKADTAIYDHFNRTFWKKVEEYGVDRMKEDVKILDEMNDKLADRCIDGGAVTNDKIKERSNKVYNPKGVKMEGYNIKDSAKDDKLCVNLIKGEIQWTREMMAAAKMNSS